MAALFEQSVHHLACRVIGIRHEVVRACDHQALNQGKHFVEQRALVAIGPHQAFVNADGERNGEDARNRVDEQGDRLQGMSHNVFGLGAAIGLLMQELDSWHLLTAFGHLDAIADQDQPAVDAHWICEDSQHHLGPQNREPTKLDGAAMKVLAERVVYNSLRKNFHSSAIELGWLTVLWAQVVLRIFTNPVRVNGRLVLVGDGIKVAKRGKKMPAVKLLHQQSNCSTKPEYIMGHSLQAIALLVNAVSSVFAVPLAIRIHEGLVWSNRDKRTLLDKMLALIQSLMITGPYYFVADAYYAAGKMVNGLLKQGSHLVSRVKSNAVAFLPAEPQTGPRKRGRPKRYGKKIKLKSLLSDVKSMEELVSPVYGEHGVKIRYRVRDLLWRPVGQLVRFVAVVHPTRGPIVLMTTDLSLGAIDIIRIYGLRFKIEHTFRQAAHQIGLFAYHFWMMDMRPLRYRNGNQYLHRMSDHYRDQVRRKIHAYHVFMQAGAIAHGLLQYLATEGECPGR